MKIPEHLYANLVTKRTHRSTMPKGQVIVSLIRVNLRKPVSALGRWVIGSAAASVRRSSRRPILALPGTPQAWTRGVRHGVGRPGCGVPGAALSLWRVRSGGADTPQSSQASAAKGELLDRSKGELLDRSVLAQSLVDVVAWSLVRLSSASHLPCQ